MEPARSERCAITMARLFRRSVMAFCLAVLTLVLPAGATPAPPCTRLVTAAMESLNRIQYAEAEELYRQASEDPACRLDALLGLAEVGNRTGKRRDAQRAASEVLAATSDPVLLAEAHFQLGNSAYRRGSSWNRNRREAEAAFLRAVELSGGRHSRAVERLRQLYEGVDEPEVMAALEHRFPHLEAEAQARRDRQRARACSSSSELLPPPAGWPDSCAPPVPGHVCSYAGPGPAPKAIVRAPEAIQREMPTYPEDARALRIQGTVILRGVINERGLVEQLHLAKSLVQSLDDAAMAAIRKSRFSPAITDEGKPVACHYVFTMSFALN